MMRFLVKHALTVAALLMATGAVAQADDFPSRPVQLMVAYPPGGSTDVGARVVAAIAEKILGKPMVVLNKGGAGGQVGWTEMSRQKPDGYYIGYLNLPATLIICNRDYFPICRCLLIRLGIG